MRLLDAFLKDMESTVGVEAEKVSIIDTWQATPPNIGQKIFIQEYLKDVSSIMAIYLPLANLPRLASIHLSMMSIIVWTSSAMNITRHSAKHLISIPLQNSGGKDAILSRSESALTYNQGSLPRRSRVTSISGLWNVLRYTGNGFCNISYKSMLAIT